MIPKGKSKYSSDVSNVDINIGDKTTAEYFKGYGGTSAIEVVNNNEVTSPIRIDMTEAERADIKKYQCTGIRRNKSYSSAGYS